MSQKTGWEPMPTALKIVFVYLAIGAVFSLLSLTSVGQVGYVFFGFPLTGGVATILSLLISTIGVVAILVGVWQRQSWAGYLGAGYFGYFILNSLLSIPYLQATIDQALDTVAVPEGMPEMNSVVYAGAYTGLVIGIAVNVVLLVIFLKHLKYFKK